MVCKVILTDACSAITCTELKNAASEEVVHSAYEISVHEGIVFRGERIVVPAAVTSPLVNFAHENH